jgi:hypothetical protein
VASAWLLVEKHFHKMAGHPDPSALATLLGRQSKHSHRKDEVA